MKKPVYTFTVNITVEADSLREAYVAMTQCFPAEIGFETIEAFDGDGESVSNRELNDVMFRGRG